MTKKLDDLIAAAKAELAKAEAGSDNHKTLTGKVEALTSMKTEGAGFTQDDLNRIDRKAKEDYEKSIKDVLGMSLDEVKTVIESVEGSLDEGEGDEGDNVLQRMQSSLEERDKKIEDLEGRTTGLSRSLYSERIESNLRRAFNKLEVGDGDDKREVKLKDGRFDLVRRLAGEDELVQKAMNGEAIDAGAYAERVRTVYAGMPEVFEGDRQGVQNDGDSVVAGHRIKEERPFIPATPGGRETSEITDQDRASRASHVY